VFDAVTLGRIEPVLAYQDLANVGGELNSSLWTIRTEFACYLIVLGLGVIGLLRRSWVILCLFAAAFAARVFVHVPSLQEQLPAGERLVTYGDHLDLVVFFLAGACFYAFRDRIPRSRGLAVSAATVWLAAALLHGLWVVSPIVLTYLIFYVGYTPRARFKDFSRRGDLSYGIYLYGWPAQLLVAAFVSDHLRPYVFLLVCMPLVVLLAAISWGLVEQPALSLKRTRRSIPRPVGPSNAEPDSPRIAGDPLAAERGSGR
jgi:peptidoglycan/LPS O-acetylase OafA/YrhL